MVRIDTPTMAALCAAGAIAGLFITAPSALAEPDTPSPPPAAGGGVPHLSSPDNLPPGTTDAPGGPPEAHGLTYLRELWNAVQTQDISGKDAAILLLTQRPMDPNAAPPPGLAAGPQQAAPAPQVPN